MKKLKALFSVFFATISFSAHAVIGGSLADTKEYPFYARLGSVDVDIKNNSFSFNDFCGGTIIDKNHILTSAHCFNNNIIVNSKTEIDLGSDFNIESSYKWYSFNVHEDLKVVVYNYQMGANAVQPQELKKIDKIIMHPNVVEKIEQSVLEENNPLITKDDLVVIKLKKTILDNVQSIDFNIIEEPSFISSNTLKSVGFGNHFEVKCEFGKQYEFSSIFHNQENTALFFECQENNGKFSLEAYRDSTFKDVETAFLSKNACDAIIGNSSSVIIGDGMDKEESICYGHPDTIQEDTFVDTGNPLLISTLDNTRKLGRSCTFDSGSPLVVEDSNGLTYPVGVVSYDTSGACSENGLSVAMDIVHYKDWILNAVKVSQVDISYELIPVFFNSNAGDYLKNTIQRSKGDGLTLETAMKELGLKFILHPVNPDKPGVVLPPSFDCDTVINCENKSKPSGGSTGLITLLGLVFIATRRFNKK